MNFIAELKRRNVLRAAGLYLVGSWIAVQVAGTILPMFSAPGWIARSLVIVLAVGFLPAMVVSWVFELTPEGIKRDDDVPIEESIAPQTARHMDRWLLVLSVVALGYFAFDKFVLAPQREAALVTQTTAHVTAQISAAKTRLNPRSIAVLPFENLSADPENEFFSDGLSEEILNSLARIDAMQVIGRASSFQFKGRNEDVRSIGDRLGVANVLEGSVRREGEQARITAQLIRASDGVQLWSQTYDRTVKDSLAVQLDIAEQVAGVLNVVLDDQQRERMRKAGVKNVDAFIAYQKGWRLYIDAHSKQGLDLIDTLGQANLEFDKATALEPDFSFAYYAKADHYEHILIADGRSPAERLDAQRAALRILELSAETSPDAQQREVALAERQMLGNDWHGLADRIESALRQPGCSAPNWLPVFAGAFGYGDLIENLGARVNTCDPLNTINYRTRARVALAAGKPDRALAILAAEFKASGRVLVATPDQAIAMVMQGRIDEARKLLATVVPTGEGYYIASVIVGTAAGEDAASIHARLQGVDRTTSKLKSWTLADTIEAALSGDRVEADRQASALDARPAGGLLLAWVVDSCLCGAPFDLDATPNFKARLAESGLHWPPPQTIKYPPRAKAAAR